MTETIKFWYFPAVYMSSRSGRNCYEREPGRQVRFLSPWLPIAHNRFCDQKPRWSTHVQRSRNLFYSNNKLAFISLQFLKLLRIDCVLQYQGRPCIKTAHPSIANANDGWCMQQEGKLILRPMYADSKGQLTCKSTVYVPVWLLMHAIPNS